MKMNEILSEGGIDSDAQHGRDMRGAFSDMAQEELIKVEEDPVGYFGQYGQQIAPEQAQQISQMLGSVDDRTFDLIANSKIMISSLQNNADENGQSFLDIDSLMQVLQKVQARSQA